MPETIVVTGTATGWDGTVKKFAAEGGNVVATVRKETDLETHSVLPSVKTLVLDLDDASRPSSASTTTANPSGGSARSASLIGRWGPTD